MGKLLSLSNQKGGTSKSSSEYDYIIIDSEGIDERLEVGMTVAFSAVMVEGGILAERASYLIRK